MKTSFGMLIGLLAVPFTAFGHHSQAEFDNSTVIEMKGEIVAAYWRNPHVNFTFKSTNGEEWEMEAAAWNSLSRRSVPRNAVKAGDQVTVAVYRSTKRPRQLHVNNILLDNGMEIILGAGGEPRWSNRFHGGRNGAAPPPVVANAEVEIGGLFQIWSIAGGRRVPLDQEPPLTDMAQAQQAAWDPITEDPLLQCVPPGMPPTMGNPYPMQFTQQANNILIYLEEFDNVRTIHMQPNEAANKPTSLGYSLGRWENGSLLVETSNINYPYFNRVGVAQSGSVATSERFTVSDNGLRLDYELTITDPDVLTEPVTWGTYYVSGRGEVIKPYECTVERYVPQ